MNHALPVNYFTHMGLVSMKGNHQPTPEFTLNRRMRNRTSGGVGGQ
jgi:hypothetical protein